MMEVVILNLIETGQKSQTRIDKHFNCSKLLAIAITKQQIIFFFALMGNTTDNCKNACLQNCQIIIKRDTEVGIHRQQKLEPIVFDDYKENQSIGNQQIEIKIAQHPNNQTHHHNDYLNGLKMASVSHVSRLNFENLVVVSQRKHSPRHIQDQHIDVPSEVVLISISRGLKKTIDQVCEEIWLKYQDHQQTSKKWKLHKKGFYINYLGERLCGVLTSDIYYEGQLLEMTDNLVPHNEGILITEKGVYRGEFINGKANGEGTFKDIQNRSIFKGIWKEGKMIEGSIETADFKFEGILVDGQVEGRGKLKFKQNKGFFYQGYFENGLFNDQKGFLISQQYTYEGGFKEGRKQGKGKLTQIEFSANNRQKQKQQALKNYKPAQEYDGLWHNDSFQKDKNFYKSRLNTPVR